MNRDDQVGIGRVALIGNYLPRRCGIATFTTDLAEAIAGRFPETEPLVLAMNDVEGGYEYLPRVRFEVFQERLFSYQQAAEFINQNEVDVVNLQHEYGIFGGEMGAHILNLLRNLSAPVVATLHTVLHNPNGEQLRVLNEIERLSDRLVVMSERAATYLQEAYRVPAEKIDLIPHGIPDIPFVDSSFHKDKFNVEGRFVLLTFGLLSEGKGIEYAIHALPEIVRRHPEVVYLVLGATHPHVLEHEGERYRESLEKLARELGVGEHVRFYNQFVSLEELIEFIGAADVYITPYLNREQIASGTLAYTLGAGKAVISSPYYYAEEMLANGRGALVPFRNSAAIAEKTIYLIENEVERQAMRKRAYLFGREMIWPAVAEKYMESFVRARQERMEARRRRNHDSERPCTRTAPAEIRLDHLQRLTDNTGILQHAVYAVPNRLEGYSTDDNARALIVAVELENSGGGQAFSAAPGTGNALKSSDGGRPHASEPHPAARSGRRDRPGLAPDLAARYLAFLWYAFDPQSGRFHNFLSYDRRWLDEVGSEDCHGRAMWSLGHVLGRSRREELYGAAGRLFTAAAPAVNGFTSPRAWAFSLLGIHEYLKKFPGDRMAAQLRQALGQRLLDLHRANAAPDWPWFEDIVAYSNASMPRALLAAGQAMNRPDQIDTALAALEWLMQIQFRTSGWPELDEEAHFSPVGCNGFYQRAGKMACYDQQPVEACAAVLACLDACDATGKEIWMERAERAFAWFHGRNDLGLPLYDPETGGCHDGLHIDRINQNQGAESTLAYLLAALAMRAASRRRPGGRQSRETPAPERPAVYSLRS